MARKKTSFKPKAPPKQNEETETKLSTNGQFPIVGVGASAGGLEAFTQLFRNLPAKPGIAFVLIQHLAPAHESMLTELLSKVTVMSVREVKDGMAVEPDNVYVIPPDSEMVIFQGVLHLTPREKTRGQYMPVDSFLRSLAQDRRNNAIAVIMSGSGSDGSNGIRAIKGDGGIVFAQDETAKYDGMPKSAIDTGCVDFVLPPDKIAVELLRIKRHPYLAEIRHGEPAQIIPAQENDLNKIFIMLRSAKGVDFTSYKRSTIMRRVNRRMLLQKIEGTEEYIAYLKENPSEIETLYQDVLINVTSFFREPGAFEALKISVFPYIANKAAVDVPVRIWVPACSTGEEAYSIAIALVEYMEDNKISRPIQLFATDIDELAVEKARKGIYPENISSVVSQERLSRFFEKTGGGYVINKSVREVCIFAKQNMVKDPPFSKIDLISCRNVLIYFGPELQKKTISILFYALNPRGFLMIGPSETVGEFAGLFSMVDKKHTIYARKAEQSRSYFEAAAVEYVKEKAGGDKKIEGQPAGVFDIQKEADIIVLNKYSPAGFVINEAMKILQFRGDTGRYLRPAPGEASLNLLKMVSDDLVAELRTALHQAKKENVQVRKERTRFNQDKRIRYININIVPFKAHASGERCFLVLFEEIGKSSDVSAGIKSAPAAKGLPEGEEMVRLRQELVASKAHLNTVTLEYEAANEELSALNEELQSSNEEMQSVNEEMETAREELQSTNEELTTVNDELQTRNEETTQLNNDLFNVLRGIEIPIIILGSELQVRRFNDAAAKLLNLIPSDAGRPLGNIRTNISIPDLEQMVHDVINTLVMKQREVQDDSDHWYSLTIRPYKTVDNRIGGVLLTLVDIDDIKRTLVRVKEAYDYANAVVETVREPLLVLDPDLRVITANRSFYENFLAMPEETENRFIYDLGDRQWNIPELRNLLEKVLPEDKAFSDLVIELELSNIGRRVMILNARKIYLKEPYFKTALNTMGSFDRLILLAIEDITERKMAEEAQGRLAAIVESAEDAIIGEDLNGIIQTWNVGAENIFGYKAEEVIGKPISLLIPLGQTDEVPVNKQGDHTKNFETVCKRKDGTIIPVSLTFSPVKNASGKVIGASKIAHDITKRKQAKEALRESKKRYHSLFENMLNGFAYCKMLFEDGRPQDFIYLDVNSAFEKLTGLKNVVGRKVTEVIPGIRESHPVLFEIYGRVALTGKPESFEIFLEPLASWLFVSVYSTERGYFVAVFDNITERKRTESITQARLRILSMAASPPTDRDETLQMMLDEIEKQTGSTIGFFHFLEVDQETLSLQAWSTNTLRDMCTAEGKGSHYNISKAGVWVDCIRERGPVIHNDYASLANRKGLPPGHAPVKREMVVPILRGGRIVAIIGVGNKPTDYITTDVEIAQFLGQLSWEIFERIRAVDELQAAHAEVERHARELELAYKDMESFSYSISHDLRAPLRTISGFIKILVEDYAEQLDVQGRDYMDRVYAGSEKMGNLIENLLDLSRISKHKLDRIEFNMSNKVASIFAGLRAINPGRTVEVNIQEGLVVHADPGLTDVVLSNLLENAWKFTSKKENSHIDFGAFEQDGKAVYYVRDNGAGFDPTHMDKMFGPFQRLHFDKEFEGMGIGLSIVERIIRRHGGRVWAEGEIEKGATFFFTLN